MTLATRRAHLDGMRGVAVGLVLLYHLAPTALPSAGVAGVTAFFVLSGYLITTLLVTELRSEGRINLVRFYAKRVARLAPPMLVVVGSYLGLVVLGLAPGPVSGRNWVWVTASAAYASNLVIAVRSVDFVMPLTHLWSLATEEQFYLLWPPLLLVVMRSRSVRPAVVCFVLVGVADTIRAALAGPALAGGVHTYYLPTTWAEALLAGCVLSLAGIREHSIRSLQRWEVPVTAVLIAGAFPLLSLNPTVSFTVTGFAVISAAVIAMSESSTDGPQRRVLSSRVLVILGRRSYSLYLVHLPVIEVLRIHVGPGPSVVLVGVVTSLVLAEGLYRFVEIPALRAKDRIADRLAPRTVDLAQAPSKP